jgi:hypothetical protein
LGKKPGLRHEKPTTKCLSNGTDPGRCAVGILRGLTVDIQEYFYIETYFLICNDFGYY